MKLTLMVPNSDASSASPAVNLHTLTALLDGFILRCKAKSLSPATIRWYKDTLTPFLTFLESRKIKDMGELTPADIRAFLEHSRAKGHCHGTVYRAYTGIGTFLGFLLKEGLIEKNPIELVEKPKNIKPIISPLNMEQSRALLEQFDHDSFPELRTWALTILLLDTGLRISEALGIKKNAVDLQRNSIRVLGKGGKERDVPLGNTAKQALLQYMIKISGLKGQELLFLNRFGGGINRRTIQRQLQLYGLRAGITGVRISPHTIRHTFATQYILNGGDAFSLQKILGHSSLDMVRVYVDMAGSNVALQHRKYSPMDQLQAVPGIKKQSFWKRQEN